MSQPSSSRWRTSSLDAAADRAADVPGSSRCSWSSTTSRSASAVSGAAASLSARRSSSPAPGYRRSRAGIMFIDLQRERTSGATPRRDPTRPFAMEGGGATGSRTTGLGTELAQPAPPAPGDEEADAGSGEPHPRRERDATARRCGLGDDVEDADRAAHAADDRPAGDLRLVGLRP